MNKDNFNRDKIVLLYPPTLVAPTVDVNTGEVDLALFESATFYVLTGTSADTLDGSNFLDATIEASATSGSGFAAVAATEIITSDATPVNTFAVVNAAGDIDSAFALGYKGNLQFARLAIDVTGTLTAGVYLCVIAVLSHAQILSTGQTVQSA